MRPAAWGTGVPVYTIPIISLKKNPKPFSPSVPERSHRSLYSGASGGLGGTGLTLIVVLSPGDVLNLEWRNMLFLHLDITLLLFNHVGLMQIHLQRTIKTSWKKYKKV